MTPKSTSVVCRMSWTVVSTQLLTTFGLLLVTLPTTISTWTSLSPRGSKAFVSQIDISTLPCISVDATALPFVNEVRNLGAVMSSNLSWRSHVVSISRRVHFSLHRLKYRRNVLSRELRSTLVTFLIFHILDYCCLVYNNLSNELNTKLQQLINCGIRFIFDLRRDVHISPYRRSLGWLTVRSRRLYFLGIAPFNILQGNSPPYLRDLFTRSTPSLRPSRHLNLHVFAIPNFRISTFRNSIHLSAIYFWHSLPDTVRFSPTIRILKGRLFRYLYDLELQLNWCLYVSCGLWSCSPWAQLCRHFYLHLHLDSFPRFVFYTMFAFLFLFLLVYCFLYRSTKLYF